MAAEPVRAGRSVQHDPSSAVFRFVYAFIVLLVVGLGFVAWEYHRMWHAIGNWYALQGVMDMLVARISENDCRPPRDWIDLAQVYHPVGEVSGWTLGELQIRIGVDFDAMVRHVAEEGKDAPEILSFRDPPGNESELASVNARLRETLENCRRRYRHSEAATAP